MSHNGGRVQANGGFLQIGGGYELKNHWLQNQGWTLGDNSGTPPASMLDPITGYPISISHGGVYSVFYIPPPSRRSGNWVVGWLGTGTVFGGGTPITGAVSGTNGSYTCLPSGSDGRIVMGITAIDVGDPIRKLWFVHETEIAEYLAGQNPWSTKFLGQLHEGGIGVWRDLDWNSANTNYMVHWQDRMPVDHYAYGGGKYVSRINAGTSTGTSSAFQATLPGFVAATGSQITFIAHTSAAFGSGTEIAATLRVNGGTAYPIKNRYGNVESFGAYYPQAGLSALFTLDLDLGCWLCSGPGNTGVYQGPTTGVPVELMLDLCRRAGMHPWFVSPFLAGGANSDYMPSLAAMAEQYKIDNGCTWMRPRYELGSNELWNSGGSFPGTRYAWEKAFAYWGGLAGTFNHHNYMGRVASQQAQAVIAAAGPSSGHYELVIGVQTATYTFAADSDPRLNSTLYVSQNGGTPAKNFITKVCCTNYWGSSLSLTQELALAHAYNSGDASALVTYISTNYINEVITGEETWLAWAQAKNPAIGVTCYEGGYSPDYFDADMFDYITGISKASQAIITISNNNNGVRVLPPVGSSVLIGAYIDSGAVAGMTQINGLTGVVQSYSGLAADQVKVAINSTGFSTYTSGGSIRMVNSMDLMNVLRKASKFIPEQTALEKDMLLRSIAAGADFPSEFDFSGNIQGTGAWAIWDPDVYRTPEPPRWTALKEVRALYPSPNTMRIKWA